MSIVDQLLEMRGLLIERNEREPFTVKLSQSGFAALKKEVGGSRDHELVQSKPKFFGMILEVVPDECCVSVRAW